MVAAMRLMTGHTVFNNWWMFKSKGASFFRVAFVAKVLDRIGLYHLGAKSTMRSVAVSTLDFALLDRVVRLFVQLTPQILVTCQTQSGLSCFEVVDGAVVDSVAVNTGDIVPFMDP